MEWDGGLKEGRVRGSMARAIDQTRTMDLVFRLSSFYKWEICPLGSHSIGRHIFPLAVESWPAYSVHLILCQTRSLLGSCLLPYT